MLLTQVRCLTRRPNRAALFAGLATKWRDWMGAESSRDGPPYQHIVQIGRAIENDSLIELMKQTVNQKDLTYIFHRLFDLKLATYMPDTHTAKILFESEIEGIV